MPRLKFISLTFATIFFLGIVSAVSVFADSPAADITVQADTTPPIFPPDPLLTPVNGATVDTFKPTFDWADATDAESEVVSYTLVMTSSLSEISSLTTTTSTYESSSYLSNGIYTWTVQAYDTAGNASELVTPPYTFTLQATALVYLPLLFRAECPGSSAATYGLIPIDGPRADRPDYLHADLNLSMRGYEPTGGLLSLVDYNGSTDGNAPQLAGLFEPNRFPGISAVYQVYDWNWACGAQGCRGPLITNPAVTLTGLVVGSSTPISIPERNLDIYPGGYKVMVLYAEEKRISFGYTRHDTVANGYAVHLEGVCVDPNLLALYRAQVDGAGYHVTGWLPGLKNNQPLGTTLGSEIKVSIRDRGTFMDPRSRKDWWQGY
jgi:hypothetical protein